MYSIHIKICQLLRRGHFYIPEWIAVWRCTVRADLRMGELIVLSSELGKCQCPGSVQGSLSIIHSWSVLDCINHRKKCANLFSPENTESAVILDDALKVLSACSQYLCAYKFKIIPIISILSTLENMHLCSV